MTKVVALMSMSLDGYVADLEDGVDEIFDWYFSGDVDIPTVNPDFTFHVSAASAEYLRALTGEVGAMLTGRRTADRADAWGGQHPFGVPAFVVTHQVPEGWHRSDSTVHFVTDGLGSAVAQAKAAAGDKIVGMHGPDTIRQCLDAGLVDEIRVDLVPLLLGSGIRLFDRLVNAPIALGNPTVVEGVGVTHLNYPVLK
ncbi:dihydrofolate reductase family protein [Arthrobacter sp. FW306-04-A]|uniref:dihydrofolate reductase family protein n=1 Tax=Arthrobacter sp. FW306-04-A TaxID=2879619 RepID=UPI0037BEB3C3|nr:dihydrofolate reductase family protein [Arthrobacter sp. FW306-04-A]